ncbi:MAG TPA: hypothetical protein VJV79_18405 [Polyangiaceae bacterium]|nr:hypothetical protein [Polyangiaceae bacterium]
MKLALGSVLLGLAVAACSGRRLPAGTPPPEYEPPLVTPWQPENASAGSEAEAGSVSEGVDGGSPAAVEPELSLDAGPR